jgi:hypothetical protein
MEKKETQLNINSYLSIGLIVVMISGTAFLATELAKIRAEISMTNKAIVVLQEKVSTRMGDRWTATMMGVWAREFQTDNPTLKLTIPVVQKIQTDYPPAKVE